MKELDRYVVCGTYGAVRIFDTKHQKYMAGVDFITEEEAEDFLFSLFAPKDFSDFLKREGPPKKEAT